MPVIRTTVVLPAEIWHAVQRLAPEDGDANTVILRAVEEYITASRNPGGTPRSGKYQKLVRALSTPVADLKLSARPATALQGMNIRYVYELVALEPRDLQVRPNVGRKSLKEITEKLAALGLTLGMTLDEDSYSAAVVATVAAAMGGTRRERSGAPTRGHRTPSAEGEP